MRKLLFVLIVTTLFLIVPFTHTDDASMLAWGIAEDYESNYNIEIANILTNASRIHSETMSEITVVKFYHLPDIPQEVDLFHRIPGHDEGETLPFPWISGSWLNGTSIPHDNESLASYQFWIAIMNEYFAVPLGNWNLLTTLMETSYEGVDNSYDFEVFENSSFWGYQQSYVSSNYVGYGEKLYHKQDGVLANSFTNMSLIFSDHVTADLRIITRDTPPSNTGNDGIPNLGIELYLIVGGAAISLIVLIVLLRKR
ncbi:MAG: hypothetical protein ACXAEN_04495 [Candidatus Thorarchaeota archaeon]|jgi:hypothetical protein